MEGLIEYLSALPIVYIARRKLQLDCACFNLLDGMEDPLLSTASLREAASTCSDFSGMTVDIWFEFVQSTFLVGDKLGAA